MKQESDKPFIKTRHLPDQLTREGDEKRGERMVTRGRGEGEENFMQIDKDLLTHYLYVSLQDTRTGL